MATPPTFLTAYWRNLLMVNYKIDPTILEPLLPKYVSLDLYQNDCFVSMVGFMFDNTKLKGISVPLHTSFEEVNLRFYVKRTLNDGTVRRAVVFVKELVPKPILAWVAQTIYREPYFAVKMEHFAKENDDMINVGYRWQEARHWNTMEVLASKSLASIQDGSIEQFITEHYWGYTRWNALITSEYEVKHPVWQIYPVKECSLAIDFKANYGEKFAFLNGLKPENVLLAKGSEVSVMGRRKLKGFSE